MSSLKQPETSATAGLIKFYLSWPSEDSNNGKPFKNENRGKVKCTLDRNQKEKQQRWSFPPFCLLRVLCLSLLLIQSHTVCAALVLSHVQAIFLILLTGFHLNLTETLRAWQLCSICRGRKSSPWRGQKHQTEPMWHMTLQLSSLQEMLLFSFFLKKGVKKASEETTPQQLPLLCDY